MGWGQYDSLLGKGRDQRSGWGYNFFIHYAFCIDFEINHHLSRTIGLKNGISPVYRFGANSWALDHSAVRDLNK